MLAFDRIFVALLPFIVGLVAVQYSRQRPPHDHRRQLEQVGLVLAKRTARNQLLLQQLNGLERFTRLHELNIILFVDVVHHQLLLLWRQAIRDDLKDTLLEYLASSLLTLSTLRHISCKE